LLNMPFQTCAFFCHMAGKGLPTDQCHVTLFGDRLNILLGQAVYAARSVTAAMKSRRARGA
jgi:hypothetical protein